MLVYLTKPLKGYAHREGEVINLPSDLATKVVSEGGALPYIDDDKKSPQFDTLKVSELSQEVSKAPTKQVSKTKSKNTRK